MSRLVPFIELFGVVFSRKQVRHEVNNILLKGCLAEGCVGAVVASTTSGDDLFFDATGVVAFFLGCTALGLATGSSESAEKRLAVWLILVTSCGTYKFQR